MKSLQLSGTRRDALGTLKYKAELVRIVRMGYVNVVVMQGERLFPAGSPGVCRKGRFDMCKRDFLGTQWHEQRHSSEEMGIVQINWNRDFTYWRGGVIRITCREF